ncbi:valacyclovir hydrolase [Cyprinus carpio]|uniref:Valacyclovir hydrolase n=1 Tax=Cyprinus carpio TaxID=7962 RepID=A0A9Q9Z916_CYPCA|nr:valacyclovir hydrolase [Cyprinus carpio]
MCGLCKHSSVLSVNARSQGTLKGPEASGAAPHIPAPADRRERAWDPLHVHTHAQQMMVNETQRRPAFGCSRVFLLTWRTLFPVELDSSEELWDRHECAVFSCRGQAGQRAGIISLSSSCVDFSSDGGGWLIRGFSLLWFLTRGYGGWCRPEGDFPPDFFHRDAKDAVDLMQALGLRRFSLLGWSDGGITALIAAALNPALIQKMVVWGSNAYVSQEDVQIYQSIRDVSSWSERMRRPMEEMYGAQYFRETWERWVDGISRFAQNPQGNICREVLPLISCPTLIVHGAKDPMVPSFHAEYLQQNIRGSRLHVMPEAKHNLHLRYPTEFNTLLQEFLTE